MNENMIDAVYAKLVKVGKDVVRVETKNAEDLDSWPTFVGEMSRIEAEALVAAHSWTEVLSWQEALKLEGWTKPWPRTTLV